MQLGMVNVLGHVNVKGKPPTPCLKMHTFLESAPCPANFLLSCSVISSRFIMVYSLNCRGLNKLLNDILKNVLAFISATGIIENMLFQFSV